MNRANRKSLLVLSALLLASGVLRMGAVGTALARETAGLSELEQECTSELGLQSLMDELSVREDRVRAQEETLENRLIALRAAEQIFREQTEALIAAEEALASTMARADTAAADDVARLVEVYENMKPQEAATLFEEMAPEFAAGFIGEMNAEAAASLMAGLDPQFAYAVSVILAGRNANAPQSNP